MQSSSTAMVVETPQIKLTLENLELFFDNLSLSVWNHTNPLRRIANLILPKYLHYLNQLAHGKTLASLDKIGLTNYLARLKQLDEANNSIPFITAIKDDVAANGKFIGPLFSNFEEFINFINSLHDKHSTYLQLQPTPAAPKLPARAPEISHQAYVFVSHDQTLDKILREGNEYFSIDNFEGALSIYLKGQSILEAQLETRTQKSGNYSRKIHHQIAKCYLQLGKKMIDSNKDLAQEYWELALEESQHSTLLGNTWLDAQINLIMLENNNGIAAVHSNVFNANRFFRSSFARIHSMLEKFPQHKDTYAYLFDGVRCNMIENLLWQYNLLTTFFHHEKLKIAREIIEIATALRQMPENKHALNTALAMQENITLILLELLKNVASNINLSCNEKLQLVHEIFMENDKISSNEPNTNYIIYQNKFIISIAEQIRKFTNTLAPIQIPELGIAVKRMLSKLPPHLREVNCNTVFTNLIRNFITQVNAYINAILLSQPHNYFALCDALNNFVIVINLYELEPALFPREEKTRWYQLYLCYALKKTQTSASHTKKINIKYIKQVFLEYAKLIIAPSPITQEFIDLQRQISLLLFSIGYAQVKLKNKIYFLSLSSSAIGKVPLLSLTDLDLFNIRYNNKLIQIYQAQDLYAVKINQENADTQHDEILKLIGQMEDFRVPELENENKWWTEALEVKRNKIIKLYYKTIDKLIEALGTRLFSPTMFFAQQSVKKPKIEDLRELYFDSIKPLKYNKTGDLCCETDQAICDYLRRYPSQRMGEPLLVKILESLETLCAFEAEADEPCEKMKRSYSIPLPRSKPLRRP
jgi:hypothetical protein